MVVRYGGQGEYLASVIASGGVAPLSASIIRRRPFARDVTRIMAIALVRDLVASAAKAAKANPARYGIGGPINVWTLDQSGPKRLPETP